MQQHFLRQFQAYLSTYRSQIAANAFVLTLISPMYGFADTSTYDNWKLSNDLRYYEVSNLVYELTHNESLVPLLQEFGSDLLSSGYDSIESHDFDKTTVKEQIKLIYIILTTEITQ